MDEQQFFKERTENSAIAQVVQRYLPFWPIFIITILSSVAVAWYMLRAEQRIYVAAAKVLLKDPQKGGGDSKVLDALNIFSEKKIVENEIVVLKSSEIMKDVVRELDLYSSVYNKGNVRVEELYKDNSPITFVALRKDSVYGWNKYFFSIDWATSTVTINETKVPFNGTIKLDFNVYRLVINPRYNHNVKGKNYFVQLNSIEGAAGALISNLSASAISNASTVLDVKLNTPVPEKGKDVLTKLFQIYNDRAITDKNQIASKTMNFINERLEKVSGQLDSVERGIQAYKTRESVVDLGSQAELYLGNVREFDKRRSELEIQQDVLSDINNYVNSKGKKTGTVPSLMLVNDPTLASLLGKLYDAEFQLDKNRSLGGEQSDAVLMAEAQVSRIKNDINENLRNIRNNLAAQKSSINSSIGQNSGLLRSIPRKERGLLEISRQQEIKNAIYSYLLQKREETALSSASTTADLRVLETASSYGPIKPVSKNYYLAALVIGVFAGVAFVLLKEQFNQKVLFRTEVEAKTKTPVIGEIAQVDAKDPVVISEGKRTIIAEQFRSLRTNLSFMGLNEIHKSILITSSISGEGKSFVAINLAMSLTLTGKRVALLELDLRKPKVSKLLKIPRDPGITNYLVNKATVDQITKTTAYPNLFVLSAGPIPPNPTELIVNERFAVMMAELKQKFDYIIIDTAPIGPVTDAQLLKDYADTTIFVVRHGVTPKVFLKLIDDLERQKKFKNMSIIFNGVKRRGFSYGRYGYGSYGQTYGYGGSYGGYTDGDSKPGFWKRFKGIFGG